MGKILTRNTQIIASVVAVFLAILLVIKVIGLGDDGGVASSKTSLSDKEVSLDSVLISINSDKYTMLKADFSVIMARPSDKKNLEKSMESVRQTVLKYLFSADSKSLHTEKGKEALKEELIEVLEERFGYDVEAIYFKNFVLVP
jgi:flagellar FliL protein